MLVRLVLQGVAKSSKGELVQLPGISDVTAGRITAWFGTPDNILLATALASLWTSRSEPLWQADAQREAGVSLAGMTLLPGDEIVATGAIGVTRGRIQEWSVSFSSMCPAALLR